MNASSSSSSSRRPPGTAERRRPTWRAFRHAYPTFLKIAGLVVILLVAFDFWLWHERRVYEAEVGRLRSAMTASEREKSDLLVSAEHGKLTMALALAKHQARWDPQLHLSVAVDSGRMYLTRDGALLRDMRVEIVPEVMPVVPDDSAMDAAGGVHGRVAASPGHRAPAQGPDSATVVRPRGERTIQEIQTDSTGATPTAIVLVGGTRIFGSNDSTVAQSGDVRMTPADFKAIVPNVSAGMTVYFY